MTASERKNLRRLAQNDPTRQARPSNNEQGVEANYEGDKWTS